MANINLVRTVLQTSETLGSIMYITLFNLPNNFMNWGLLIALLHGWGNQGSEVPHDLPKFMLLSMVEKEWKPRIFSW